MPTGIAPTTYGELVVALDDGLHVVNASARTSRLLAAYPAELNGRCNDVCADGADHVITGKLNLGPAQGSAWRYSVGGGWSKFDDDIANTNGPCVGMIDGRNTLIVGDTSAVYYAYDYDERDGVVGDRRVFGDTTSLAGHPDGATIDAAEGVWCALFDGGQLARFTSDGLDQTFALPLANPTDVTFGGAGLDRLFVVSVGPSPTGPTDTLDGALLVIDGLTVHGRTEPRVNIAG